MPRGGARCGRPPLGSLELIEVVKTIPFNHSNQALLIKFLLALRQKGRRTAIIWDVRACYFHPSYSGATQAYGKAN
jgi:hypothetical protein